MDIKHTPAIGLILEATDSLVPGKKRKVSGEDKAGEEISIGQYTHAYVQRNRIDQSQTMKFAPAKEAFII